MAMIKSEVPLKPRDAGPLIILEHAPRLQGFWEFKISLSTFALVGFLIFEIFEFILVCVDEEITAWGRGLSWVCPSGWCYPLDQFIERPDKGLINENRFSA